PDGRGPALEAANRLLGRLGHDGDGLAQVEELDGVGPAAEDLLAQEGVEVHAAQPALLVLDRGGLAGLEVGDDEAPGVELEAVDDAPEPEGAHLDLELELEADGMDAA